MNLILLLLSSLFLLQFACSNAEPLQGGEPVIAHPVDDPFDEKVTVTASFNSEDGLKVVLTGEIFGAIRDGAKVVSAFAVANPLTAVGIAVTAGVVIGGVALYSVMKSGTSEGTCNCNNQCPSSPSCVCGSCNCNFSKPF